MSFSASLPACAASAKRISSRWISRTFKLPTSCHRSFSHPQPFAFSHPPHLDIWNHQPVRGVHCHLLSAVVSDMSLLKCLGAPQKHCALQRWCSSAGRPPATSQHHRTTLAMASGRGAAPELGVDLWVVVKRQGYGLYRGQGNTQMSLPLHALSMKDVTVTCKTCAEGRRKCHQT